MLLLSSPLCLVLLDQDLYPKKKCPKMSKSPKKSSLATLLLKTIACCCYFLVVLARKALVGAALSLCFSVPYHKLSRTMFLSKIVSKDLQKNQKIKKPKLYHWTKQSPLLLKHQHCTGTAHLRPTHPLDHSESHTLSLSLSLSLSLCLSPFFCL